jgi:extradiol dioxygenase family protein
MRSSADVFHLAIPVRDLEAAEHFYSTLLGCHIARRYDDRITVDFFGDQVVCHYSPGEPTEGVLELYPRHFGITFKERADYDALLRLVELRKIPVFQEPRTRFDGMAEEHHMIVLRDPSDNLLEFKFYSDHRMMY